MTLIEDLKNRIEVGKATHTLNIKESVQSLMILNEQSTALYKILNVTKDDLQFLSSADAGENELSPISMPNCHAISNSHSAVCLIGEITVGDKKFYILYGRIIKCVDGEYNNHLLMCAEVSNDTEYPEYTTNFPVSDDDFNAVVSALIAE